MSNIIFIKKYSAGDKILGFKIFNENDVNYSIMENK